ncbi:MAG TPA: diacylglycerol kinase family lipid kinase [Clostridiales bacterium]|nr:diacylglycerol kinase family lipid kinase [Clostridiales bacterium]
MHIFFVINPAAGKTDQSKFLLEKIHNIMVDHAYPYTAYVTKYPGDGEQAVREAAAATEEDILFVACGGDGTLNEVVNGAAGFKNALVTHFPCGSGNDFIRTFGQNGSAFYHMEKLLWEGSEQTLDLIECNGRYCLNIFSSGLDARVAYDMKKFKRLPLVSGSNAYILSLILNFFKPLTKKCRVTVDGQSWEGEYIIIVAANGSYYGGGFHPVPEANPGDGQLEFLLVKKLSRWKVAGAISYYKQGRYKEKMQYFQRFSGKTMLIEAEKPITQNLDGEISFEKSIKVSLSDQKIRFWIPSGNRQIWPENRSAAQNTGADRQKQLT